MVKRNFDASGRGNGIVPLVTITSIVEDVVVVSLWVTVVVVVEALEFLFPQFGHVLSSLKIAPQFGQHLVSGKTSAPLS